MLGGGVDAATLVAALCAGPPPPECRWGRRPHRGATACRLLERDDRGVDGPSVEGDSRLGELLEVERDEGLRAAARVAVMRAVPYMYIRDINLYIYILKAKSSKECRSRRVSPN